MDNHEGNDDACQEEHGTYAHKDDPRVVIDAQDRGIAASDTLSEKVYGLTREGSKWGILSMIPGCIAWICSICLKTHTSCSPLVSR